MRKKVLKEIEEQLRERRAFLLNKLERKREEYIEMKENETVGDMADIASDLMEKDLLYGLSISEKQELEDINNALKKIADGTYGICEMCGKEISIERLKVKPFAKYCVECREKMDKKLVNHT